MIDIYESAVEPTGRFGAVFERDEATAFFYLLDMDKEVGSRIVCALDVHSVNHMRPDIPVDVRWSEVAAVAGLFVAGDLTALFDVRSGDIAGRYADSADCLFFAPS